WVHCYRGLIEDKQFWLMSYATSDVQPAQQPSGKLLGIKPAKPAQPHKVNCFVNQPAAGTSIMDIQPAEIVDVFFHPELTENRDSLQHDSDIPLDVVGIGRHGPSKHLDGAFIVLKQCQDAVDCSCLARTVGAEQPHDLPLPH